MTPRDITKTAIVRGTAIFGSLALCATVFAARQDPHGTATPQTSPSASRDGDVLAQLIALDENEVRAAKNAEDKKVDKAILNFAKMLHQDHMNDIQATQNLAARLGIDLKNSAAADQMHDKGSQMMSKLDDLKGDAFARAYVGAMVNGHREALQMLDDALKTVQSDEVRQHLTAVRQTVAMHLRSAEALQSAAPSQKSSEPDAGPDERAQYTVR